MSQEIFRKITQVRRRSRDPDVLDICEALEAELLKKPEAPVEKTVAERPRFDKRAYQRQYMRDRRRKQKQERK